MKIQLISKTPACILAVGVAKALKEMGHDVLRSTRQNSKRMNIRLDQPREPMNKAQQFLAYVEKQVPTVPHTINKAEALSWLIAGHSVVCRTKTRGHSGDGIIIAEKEEDLVDAPLFTQYVKKKTEYRVHVFKGKVIFVQQKKLQSGFEDPNFKVRNHQFGWVFAHNDLEVADMNKLQEVAIKAVRAVGYKYGAVDIIYNAKKNLYYVLECNSRPGTEGETAKRYAEAFLKTALEAGTSSENFLRMQQDIGFEITEQMPREKYEKVITWMFNCLPNAAEKIPTCNYYATTDEVVFQNLNEFKESL